MQISEGADEKGDCDSAFYGSEQTVKGKMLF